MKPRSTARFALALAAAIATYQLLVLDFMRDARTGWGLALVIVVAGAGLALLFTVIYDGLRAVTRLLEPASTESVTDRRSRAT